MIIIKLLHLSLFATGVLSCLICIKIIDCTLHYKSYICFSLFQFYQRVAYFLTELGNYSVPFVILLIYRINLHVHRRCTKKARIYMVFFYPAMWFIIMISRQIQLQVDCCFFFYFRTTLYTDSLTFTFN